MILRLATILVAAALLSISFTCAKAQSSTTAAITSSTTPVPTTSTTTGTTSTEEATIVDSAVDGGLSQSSEIISTTTHKWANGSTPSSLPSATMALPSISQLTTVVPTVRAPQPEPTSKVVAIVCATSLSALTGSYSAVTAFQVLAMVDAMPCRGEGDGSALSRFGNSFSSSDTFDPPPLKSSARLVHFKFLSDNSFTRRILTPLSFTNYEAKFVYGSFILLFASIVFYVVSYAILKQFLGATLAHAFLFFPRPIIFVALFLLPGFAVEGFRLAIGLDNSADYHGEVDHELRITGSLALLVCLILFVGHHVVVCYYRPAKIKRQRSQQMSGGPSEAVSADRDANKNKSSQQDYTVHGTNSIDGATLTAGVTATNSSSPVGLGTSQKELTNTHDELHVINIEDEIPGDHNKEQFTGASPRSIFDVYNSSTSTAAPKGTTTYGGEVRAPPNIIFTGDDGILAPMSKSQRGQGVITEGGQIVDSKKVNATRGLLQPPIAMPGGSFSTSSSPPSSTVQATVQQQQPQLRRCASRVPYNPDSFSPNQMFLSWEESSRRSDQGVHSGEFAIDRPPSSTIIPLAVSIVIPDSGGFLMKEKTLTSPTTTVASQSLRMNPGAKVKAHDWAMKNFGMKYFSRKASIVTRDLRFDASPQAVLATADNGGALDAQQKQESGNDRFRTDADGNSCDEATVVGAVGAHQTGISASNKNDLQRNNNKRRRRLPSDPFVYLAHRLSVLVGRTLEPQPSRVIYTNKGPIEVVPEQSNPQAIVDPAYLVQPIDNSNFGTWYPLYTAKQRRKNINFFLDILFLPAGNWMAQMSYSLFAIASDYRPRFLVGMVSLHVLRTICVAGLTMYTPENSSSCDVIYFATAVVFFTHAAVVLLTFIYRVPVMNFMHCFESGLLGLYTIAPAIGLSGLSRTQTSIINISSNATSNATTITVTKTTTIPATDLIFYALCGCVALSIIFRLIAALCETIIMLKVTEANTSFEWDRFNPPSGPEGNRWITFESLFANPNMKSLFEVAEGKEKYLRRQSLGGSRKNNNNGDADEVRSDGALTNIYSSFGGYDDDVDKVLATQAREELTVSGQDPRRQQRQQWARKQLHLQEQQKRMRDGRTDWDLDEGEEGDDYPSLASLKSSRLGFKTVAQALQMIRGGDRRASNSLKDIQAESTHKNNKSNNEFPWWKRSQNQNSPAKSPLQKSPTTKNTESAKTDDLVREFSASSVDESDKARPWGGWGQVSKALEARTAKRNEMFELVDLHMRVQQESMWF